MIRMLVLSLPFYDGRWESSLPSCEVPDKKLGVQSGGKWMCAETRDNGGNINSDGARQDRGSREYSHASSSIEGLARATHLVNFNFGPLKKRNLHDRNNYGAYI